MAARSDLRRLVPLALPILTQAIELFEEEQNALGLICSSSNNWTLSFYPEIIREPSDLELLTTGIVPIPSPDVTLQAAL